jgi:autotransporter passenger strand-loop-strand repeat protein
MTVSNITVSSGVTSTGLDVLKGEALTVLSGGAVKHTLIEQGGSDNIYGSALKTSAASGGQESVFLGGVSTDAIVAYGGNEIVYAGGETVSATLEAGNEQVYGEIRADGGGERRDDFRHDDRAQCGGGALGRSCRGWRCGCGRHGI